MKIRKAVVLAAGYGTRMLPATRVVPKEILPVLDTPAIQMVVEEIVSSGITDIIFVISPEKGALLNHFAPAPDLEEFLQERGKNELLKIVRATSRLAKITSVEQRVPLGIGHAVMQARAAVGNEPFAVFLPDDVYDANPPCLRQMLDVSEKFDSPVVALLRIPRSEVSKYGIVECRQSAPRLYELTGMVEKPPADKAPSEFAIIGRYILPPEIFDLIAEVKCGAGGEIQLTDALLSLSQKSRLYGYEIDGVRYDLGDLFGFLTAQIGFGLKRPDLADRLRNYLKTIV
jgi:UTP--glucose-1-phosphate uridylyltransferase